jgi:hypothetical protein
LSGFSLYYGHLASTLIDKAKGVVKARERNSIGLWFGNFSTHMIIGLARKPDA